MGRIVPQAQRRANNLPDIQAKTPFQANKQGSQLHETDTDKPNRYTLRPAVWLCQTGFNIQLQTERTDANHLHLY